MNWYKNNTGILLALLASVISGFSIFLNKIALTSVGSPIVFTTIKNTIVGIIILLVLIFSNKLKDIKKLSKSELLKLLLVGLIGGSLPFYLFFMGLSQTSAINGALIQKTLVFWVALFAYPMLKERFTKIQLIGVGLLFISNLLVGGFTSFKFSLGELLVLIATILWGLESVIAKKVLSTVDSDLVTFFRMGLGAVVLLLASFFTNPKALISVTTLNQSQWFWVILVSGALFLYVNTWYKALSKAPAILVASILVSSTLVTNILSSIYITHSSKLVLSPYSFIMIVGVIILVVASKKQTTLINSV